MTLFQQAVLNLLQDEQRWINWGVGGEGVPPDIIINLNDIRGCADPKVPGSSYYGYLYNVIKHLTQFVENGQYPILSLARPKDIQVGELFLSLSSAEPALLSRTDSDFSTKCRTINMSDAETDIRYRVVITDILNLKDVEEWNKAKNKAKRKK